jgi:hypothetical protein
VFWKSLAAAGLVALPLVALAVAPYVTLNSAGGLPDRNLGVVRMYSASPTDFLLPSTDHFLFGRWIGANFNRDLWIEGTLYVGVITLALFVLAFVRRKSAAGGKIVSLLGWGALAGLILAMGTDLHWNGAPVILTTPDFLKGLIGRDDIPLVLPGYFLFKYFPFYAKLRAFMRFGVFVLVFVCAGAGIGSAWLVERARKERRLALAVLLTGLIIFDFYPGPYQNFAPVQARPVDSWLAQQPGDGALVQFPFIKGEDQDQTYNTLVHGKPFVGGFFNAFPPAQYTRVKPVMERFPDEESVSLMRTLGVQWVLVDVDEYEDIGAIRQESQDLGLQYIDQIGDEMVFELKP